MWAIHNSVKGWTLYNLSLREVQLLVNTLSVNEVKLTKVSSLTKNEWEIISREKHPDFFSDAGKLNSGFIDYKMSDQAGDIQTDFFVIKPKRVQQPRLHIRYEIEVKASIEGQSKSFESLTVDISEGGVHFKDTIPDWVSGYFIVRLFDKSTYYEVICSLVEDQKVKKRVQIVSEESDAHFLKYKEWINQLDQT